MAKHFEVTLTRSPSGRPETQRRTLAGLGLSRLGKTVLLKDSPPIRGMLYKVVHLVDVTSRDGEVPPVSVRARAKSVSIS